LLRIVGVDTSVFFRMPVKKTGMGAVGEFTYASLEKTDVGLEGGIARSTDGGGGGRGGGMGGVQARFAEEAGARGWDWGCVCEGKRGHGAVDALLSFLIGVV
jgi:hypothetical protein